jgi:hypothetical protein
MQGPAPTQLSKQVSPGVSAHMSDRLSRLSCVFEKHKRRIGAIIVAFIVISALGHASGTMFSYDEQITYRTALMPVRAIRDFFAQGLDTTGPVPSLLAHAALLLPHSPEIAARVPFILAFAAMCWGMFAFLRERYPAGFALSALLIPLELTTVAYFMTDARAYAIMLGAAGLGGRLWQLAAEGRSRPWSVIGLWLVLAIGMSAHFFTVFLVVPLALAQLVLDVGRRRADLPIWLALVLFPVGWLPVAPGQMRAHKLYASTFWTRATLENIADSYEQLIQTSWPIIFVLCVFLLGLALWVARKKASVVLAANSEGLRTHEWVFVIALFLLPPVAWVGALALGAFQHSYVITFAVGLTLALCAAVAELACRQASVGITFFIILVVLATSDSHGGEAIDGLAAIFDHGAAHRVLQARAQKSDWVQWLEQNKVPVIADNATYLQLDLYASPELAHRAWGITNFREAAKYPRAMTDQNNLALFGRKVGLQVADVEEFVAHNPEFTVVQQRRQRSFEWMPQYFLERAHVRGDVSIRLAYIEPQGRYIIYEVVSSGR